MIRNKSLIYIILISAFLVCLVGFSLIITSILNSRRGTGLVLGNSTPPALMFPTDYAGIQPTLLSQITSTIPLPTEAPPELPTTPFGKIVFTCQVLKDSRYNQICMMDPDGSNYQRLTTRDDNDHFYPSLAPDGLEVVFSSNQTGGYEIYSLDWSGNQVQLTDEGQVGTAGAFAPEISPDGQSIVYARVLSDSDKSIWVIDRSGNQAHWLFGSPGAGAWDPSWSPDGGRIVFMSDRTGSNQLHTIAVDGSDLKQITDLEDLRGRNDWSPDGSTVATYIGKPWQREIILMNSDGSNLRYLTKDGNNLAPSFSPDGRWVAITSYKDLYQDNNGCEIYIVSMDGSEIHRLTNNDYCDWQPRWGP